MEKQIVKEIMMRENKELNRDGGNGCSNPNWGTGRRGDANPDTQKELTVLQKKEPRANRTSSGGRVSTEINPLENPEYFASVLVCKKCDKAILVPETKERKMSPKKKMKQKCVSCGGKYDLSSKGAGLLPGIVVPLVRITHKRT